MILKVIIMLKISRKSLSCMIIVIVLIFNSTIAMAAKKDSNVSTFDASNPPEGGANYQVGKTYTFYKTLTLKNIDDLAEAIYDEQNSSFWTVAGVIMGIVPTLSEIYTVLSIAADITATKEYKFYANIRTNMIRNSYKTVKIAYSKKYKSYTANGKTMYGFELISHTVSNYYK